MFSRHPQANQQHCKKVLPDPNIPSVTHFCLPGRMAELSHTTSFLVEVFNHYEEFLGVPFPFDSYKQGMRFFYFKA